jgi:hypothetical protein
MCAFLLNVNKHLKNCIYITRTEVCHVHKVDTYITMISMSCIVSMCEKTNNKYPDRLVILVQMQCHKNEVHVVDLDHDEFSLYKHVICSHIISHITI